MTSRSKPIAEIAHEQNRVAKTGRHASMFAPAAASNALSDELVVAPVPRCWRLAQVGVMLD
jgi:hypothetical protein